MNPMFDKTGAVLRSIRRWIIVGVAVAIAAVLLMMMQTFGIVAPSCSEPLQGYKTAQLAYEEFDGAWDSRQARDLRARTGDAWEEFLRCLAQ